MKQAASILLAGLLVLQAGLPQLDLGSAVLSAAALAVAVVVAMVTAYLTPSATKLLKQLRAPPQPPRKTRKP